MRRIFADLAGLAVLIALIRSLPLNASILIGLFIFIIAGFGRGVVEGRMLKRVPPVFAAIEWAAIVFASDVVLSVPNSSSDPHDNFVTVFAAFFLVFIVPSIVLSTASFVAGLTFSHRDSESA